jgi:hypothetical protein
MVHNIMTSVPPFEVVSDMLARLGGVVETIRLVQRL